MPNNNKGQNAQDDRTKLYGFMLYEDSCNPNWKQTIDDLHIKYYWIEHNKDLKEDGTPKKIHYHLMLMFPSKKSMKQMQEIANSIGAANGHIEAIRSKNGYARYLCHLDNPDKHQYDISEVHSGGGANYQKDIKSESDGKDELKQAIREMVIFCKKENIISFADLFEYAMTHNDSWFDALIGRGGTPMREYLKSRHWTNTKLKEQLYNGDFQKLDSQFLKE